MPKTATKKAKMYVCEVQGCDKSFTRRYDLDVRHMKTHTGQVFYCPHCSTSFTQKDNMMSHCRRTHNGGAFQEHLHRDCVHCNLRFDTYTQWNDHHEKAHRPTPDLAARIGDGSFDALDGAGSDWGAQASPASGSPSRSSFSGSPMSPHGVLFGTPRTNPNRFSASPASPLGLLPPDHGYSAGPASASASVPRMTRDRTNPATPPMSFVVQDLTPPQPSPQTMPQFFPSPVYGMQPQPQNDYYYTQGSALGHIQAPRLIGPGDAGMPHGLDLTGTSAEWPHSPWLTPVSTTPPEFALQPQLYFTSDSALGLGWTGPPSAPTSDARGNA